jgi:hypothetical protein
MSPKPRGRREALMAEFRVPTVALPAEILSAEGQTLIGRIFVPASAYRHTGAMRAEEWLDEPADFFPFLADGAKTSVILNKRQVLVLSIPAAAEGDEPAAEEEAGTRRQVKVRCGGRDFEGTVLIEMPESQSRVLDHLNRPGRFLGLWDGERHRLIHKGHITSVQENREG